MASRTYECEAGVYMLRIKSTGDFYIGSSTNLTSRLNAWRAMIVNGTRPHSQGLRKAIKGKTLDDIEFRIIERVTVQMQKSYNKVYGDTLAEKGLEQLRDRERHWIRTLQPSLNVQNKKRLIDVNELPQGLPDDLAATARSTMRQSA